MITFRELRIAKKSEKEWCWWRFACGDVSIQFNSFHEKRDGKLGDIYNCIVAFPEEPWNRSWREYLCVNIRFYHKQRDGKFLHLRLHSCFLSPWSLFVGRSCLCQYPVQPLLQLWGLCKGSLIGKWAMGKHTLKQLPHDPDNIFLLGLFTTKIIFNNTTGS